MSRSLTVFVVATLLSSWAEGAVVEYRLESFDSEGSPSEFIPVGSEFQLRVSVADVRPNPSGVVSAYLDVEYDNPQVSVIFGSVEHGPLFGDVPRGDLSTPPVLDEFGSFRRSSIDDPMLPQPTDEFESLLFGVLFTANQPGYATFTTNAADVLPRHATTVFGLDHAVPSAETVFGQLEILVLPSNCDFDGDDLCDTSDIDLLNSAGNLVAGVPVAQTDPIFDLDENGEVNRIDVDIWLATAAIEDGFDKPYLRGDTNLDGKVNAPDLNALALTWRQDADLWSLGDMNGDGSINTTDLNQLALNWRADIATVVAPPVPEPSSLLFGAIALLITFICKRRLDSKK